MFHHHDRHESSRELENSFNALTHSPFSRTRTPSPLTLGANTLTHSPFLRTRTPSPLTLGANTLSFSPPAAIDASPPAAFA